MMKKIKYYSSITAYMIKLSLLKQAEYPINIISCFIMIPMMVATGILLLYCLANQFQQISGWTFYQLAFLYGFGYLSHGLMMVFSVQNLWMDETVIKGEFDRMLLRPIPVFFHFTATYINLIGLMDVLLAGLILLYSGWKLGFRWSLQNCIIVGLMLLGATLLRSSIYTIICSTAFWTKRSSSLFWLLTDLMERTTMLPLSIYPMFLQMILTVAFPIAFVSFYPACELLGKDSRMILPWSLTILTPAIGIILFLLSVKFFQYGLSKYESAGS
jgi:ABC-2 type transport system permease protein